MRSFILVDDNNRLISLDHLVEMYPVEEGGTEMIFVGGYKIKVADDYDDLLAKIRILFKVKK